MTDLPEIEAQFADRCAIAAANLHKLAELSKRPESDTEALAEATGLTASLLSDPDALLAVALTVARAMEAARRRLVDVLQQDPVRRVPDDEPLWGAVDLAAGDLIQARGNGGKPGSEDRT